VLKTTGNSLVDVSNGMFSGFDVSKYANPVFGPHLFFVSRGVDEKT
jgi:hypothetical protein